MPGVKQFFFCRSGFAAGSGAAYMVPTASDPAGSATSVEAQATAIWPIDGDFRNLRVHLDTAPGASHTVTFDLLINGVASGLTVGIADAATSGTSDATVALIAAGDEITLRKTGNSVAGAAMKWAIEFNGITAGQAGYAFTGQIATGTLMQNPLAVNNGWPSTGFQRAVIRVAGSMDLAVEMLDPPGVGSSRVFTVQKNGVDEGTFTISDSNTTGALPLPIDVVEDDVLLLVSTQTGTPSTTYARCRTTFNATSDGVANMCVSLGGLPFFGSSGSFCYPGGASGWQSAEDFTSLGIAPGGLALSLFRVLASGAVGNVSFTVRKNGTNTAVTTTLVGVAVNENNSDSVSLAVNDTWSFAHGPNGFLEGPGIVVGLAVSADSEAEQPPTPIQRVTQLFIEIASNEDIQDDPPEPVTDCTGGGEVAQGTNPEDGSALDDATTPLVWMEVTVNASPAVTYSWAKADINHGEPKEARVLEFGVRTLALSDIDGGPETATIITVLSDVDGFVRSLWQSDALLGSRVDYFIQDLPDLRAGLAPNRRFRGYIARCEPGADRTFRITVEDGFSAALNALDGQDLESPTQLIEDNIATLEPTEEMYDKPAPLVFGSVSSPTGAWEFKYVGESGGRYWFLASMGVVKIQEVFVGGLGLLPNDRIQLSESAFGASSYISADGKDRSAYTVAAGRRWTLLNGSTSSGAIRLAKEGTLPMVGNVCGLLEDQDGGSPNATVSSPPRALVLYINNYLLQDATGQWLPILTDNGISLLDTETFEDVHDKLEAMAGSPGASAIAGAVGGDFRQVSWRDRVAEFCRSFGFDFGINRHGQGILTVLDLLDDAADAETFTPRHILESSVRNLSRLPVENEIRYVHSKRYVTPLPHLAPPTAARLPFDPYANDWESGLLTIRDEPSIAALGGGTRGRRRSQVQEYTLSRHAAQSADVAQRRLDLLSPPNGRIEVAFGLTLKHGADLVLGQIVNVEHWDLPWTGTRRCQVRRLEEDLDALTVVPTVRDVDDILP